ncbi:MAG: metallophosphoesterase [Planctomycetia bacterium]|nr:metallophosphoesterase [Planctomycetia bacterium]
MFRLLIWIFFIVFPLAVWAETVPTDPNLVVFVADLHIGNDVPEHTTRLVRFCEDVAAMNPRPAAVIVLGDMVSTVGTTEEYREIVPLFSPLDMANIPWYLVVGNHDNRENMFQAFPAKKSEVPEIPGRQTQVVDLPGARFLLLDSRMDDTREYMSHKDAFPERRPWDGKPADAVEKLWIRTELAKCKKPAFLCVHHPLSQTGLEKTLEGSGYLRGYIFGHTHANSCVARNGSLILEVPSLSTRQPAPHEPAGYVVMKIQDDGVQISLRKIKP